MDEIVAVCKAVLVDVTTLVTNVVPVEIVGIVVKV